MRRWLATCLAACAASACAIPAQARIAPPTNLDPADQTSNGQQIKRVKLAIQLQLEFDVLGLPWRKMESLAKALRIERDGDNLTLKVIPEEIDDCRLFVKGMTGVLRLQARRLGNNVVGQNFGTMVNFTQRDLTGAGTVSTETDVSFGAQQLNITQFSGSIDDSDNDDSSSSIQIIQSGRGSIVDEDSQPFVVHVQEHGKPATKFAAKSFVDFCREYPVETARYLRPIFRDLQQDGQLFAADPKLAFQVFASQVIVEPEAVKKVNELAGKLDTDDFRQRTDAISKLQDLGQSAAVVLMRIDRTGMSPEKVSNIDTILGPYQPSDPSAASELLNDRFFLLDCLNLDDPMLRELAWKQLQKVTSTAVAFDPKMADTGQRAAAIQKVRDAITPTTGLTTQSTTRPASSDASK